MSAIDFYTSMSSFSVFNDISKDECYYNAPSDWYIMVTDIKGSTSAIAEGRYKDVNFIGAACIAVISNCLDNQAFPFVFGGDGATILLPKEWISKVENQLMALQKLSKISYNLELRVGYLAIEKLYSKGLELMVAKYEVSPGNWIAQLKGDAVSVAEDWIKGDKADAVTIKSIHDEGSPNLQGLSCRLRPIKSTRGKVLSILIKPAKKKNNSNVLNDVLQEFDKILGNKSEYLSTKNLKWQSFVTSLIKEWKIYRLKTNKFSAFVQMFKEMTVAYIFLKFPFKLSKKYKSDLIENSDYRKYDDMLRMIIDCTSQEALEIDSYLSQLEEDGLLKFGIHTSNSALMTCMVQSVTENRHIHFVDGSDGGYARAATVLKKKLN